MPSRGRLLGDFHNGSGRHEVEQFEYVGIAHTDASDRIWLPQLGAVRRTVDVDKTAHRIHISQTIASQFASRQPKDARQDPVAAGKLLGELRRPCFAGRTAAYEDGVRRRAGADFSPLRR